LAQLAPALIRRSVVVNLQVSHMLHFRTSFQDLQDSGPLKTSLGGAEGKFIGELMMLGYS
jgi:hypothetical protein